MTKLHFNFNILALTTLAYNAVGALAKPGHPSANENVITITVDEFHSNSNSDNGLRLSNGTSPSPTSANHNSESETHYCESKGQNDNELMTGMLTRSYSEVFMNNDSYVTPGADILLDKNNFDVESGKKALKEFLFTCKLNDNLKAMHTHIAIHHEITIQCQ